jgi:hypothetical protein
VERINKFPLIVRHPSVCVCMSIAQVFPCDIVVEKFVPSLRNLRSSGESSGVVNERKHLIKFSQ